MDTPLRQALAPSVEIFKKKDYCVIIDRKKLKCDVIHPSEALVLSLLDTKVTKNELATTFGEIYEQPFADACNVVDAVLEKLNSYLSLPPNPTLHACRYQPETFLYPGFSEYPGMTKPNDTLVYLTLVLTKSCNFRCIYCYADLSTSFGNLSCADAIRVLNEAADMGAVTLCLSGGEPLLHPDIDTIISAGIQRGLLIFLVTNGSLIDEATADKLLAAGLQGIQVSLDAPTAPMHHFLTGSKNTFDRVIAGIKMLKNRGLWVGIRSVVMQHNWEAMAHLIDLLNEFGVDEIAMSTQVTGSCHCKGNSQAKQLDEMARTFLQEMVKKKSARYPNCALLFTERETQWQTRKNIIPCGSPMGGFVVHPSGEVTICEMLSQDPAITMGNIHDSVIKDIWLGEAHLRFVQETTNPLRIDPSCARCDALDRCRTGCYNLSQAVAGDYFMKDPRCPGPDGFTDN